MPGHDGSSSQSEAKTLSAPCAARQWRMSIFITRVRIYMKSTYSSVSFLLVFLRGSTPSWERGGVWPRTARERARVGLRKQLRLAPAPSSDLFSDLAADACPRLSRIEQSAKAARIRWLSEAGAWTDAALALVQLELPEWTVRRLIRDDGAWLCSLSRHCEIPIEIDDTAEACPERLPLLTLTGY